ncbi:MAG: aminotransferase class I/II-fold pyridoxal phosphate-dependent enzyme [Bacteroidota bacterium]
MLSDQNPLALDGEKMRQLGYQVIDTLVTHLETIRDKKVVNRKSYEELADVFDTDLPTQPIPPETVFKEIEQSVMTSILHTNHPRFYSFIPGPSNFISVLADTLATGYNVFAGHWLAGSGPAQIERITIAWLAELCGYDKSSGGIFTSGGSMANLMAIATAKKVKIDNAQNGVVYYSNQTHSSVSKGLRTLGFLPHQMRPIAVGDDQKIILAELEAAVKEDSQKGFQPFCVIGNAGTTNSGTVDRLPEMATLAKRYNLWFHIDGAYGAAAVLSKIAKDQLSGIELADSITLDPHKWWFQPFEMGCLLVKNRHHLKQTFSVSAEYLIDTETTDDDEINFYDYGVQLTRSFRALKLYTSLKTYGLTAFQQAIDKGILMAEYAEQLLRAKTHWEIITPAQLGIINFRFAPPNTSISELNELSKRISEKVVANGYAMIITTQIRGETVLRMCPIHPDLTKGDLENTIEQLDRFANG